MFPLKDSSVIQIISLSFLLRLSEEEEEANGPPLGTILSTHTH